jgi:hypothetical protein
MITLRLYAHLIVPIKDKVESVYFKAINVVEVSAQYIARLYYGRIDCSYCYIVQYSDTIYLENVSSACIEGILRDFPFIKKKVNLYSNSSTDMDYSKC